MIYDVESAVERFCIMTEQQDVNEQSAMAYIQSKMSKDNFVKFQLEVYKMKRNSIKK